MSRISVSCIFTFCKHVGALPVLLIARGADRCGGGDVLAEAQHGVGHRSGTRLSDDLHRGTHFTLGGRWAVEFQELLVLAGALKGNTVDGDGARPPTSMCFFL